MPVLIQIKMRRSYSVLHSTPNALLQFWSKSLFTMPPLVLPLTSFHQDSKRTFSQHPPYPFENGLKIGSILLIEKLTRFEMETKKGKLEKDIKRLFPGAYRTYMNHKDCVQWLEQLLKHRYGIKITKHKSKGSSAAKDANAINFNSYDAIFSAGGDGTYLEAASLIPSFTCIPKFLPIFGINTDPYRSEGRLCLDISHFSEPLDTSSFSKSTAMIDTPSNSLPPYDQFSVRKYVSSVLQSLLTKGTCVPILRQRLRVTFRNMETGKESIQAHKAVNDVLIAEKQCSKALYAEIKIDEFEEQRHKCSGLIVSTGTGSSAWAFNVSKVSAETVQLIFNCIKDHFSQTNILLDGIDATDVSGTVNNRLLFHPSSELLRYVVREPIENRVFTSHHDAGVAKRIIITPLTDDVYVSLDGIESIYLPPGHAAILEIHSEDGFWTAK